MFLKFDRCCRRFFFVLCLLLFVVRFRNKLYNLLLFLMKFLLKLRVILYISVKFFSVVIRIFRLFVLRRFVIFFKCLMGISEILID